MAKKSKSKKSKAKKAESLDVENPEEAGVPSWSTDDVYNLLKAVNEITLKRMENKIDALAQRLALVPDQTKAINDRLKSVQEFDVLAIRNDVGSVFNFLNGNVYPALTAIKAKTDRLP